MKLKLMGLILGLTLLAGGLSACGAETPPPLPPAQTSPTIQVVSAEAFVHPVQEADMALETSGRVAEINVQEGDPVKKGEVILRLDDTTQQAALTEAEANLAKAEANLARAKADLAKTQAGPTPEEIAQAEANLAKAEAALAERLAGPTNEAIYQYQARVETARAELNNILADTREEDVRAASSNLLKAEAEVRLRQDDYDDVRYGDPDDVLITGVALQQATLDYEQAKAAYDKAVNGATEQEIAISRARLVEAQANLAYARAGATPEQIAQAQADVAKAEADLANLMAGSTAEDVAISEAAVKASEADVEVATTQVIKAKAELEKTQLKAPFDGQVGLLSYEVGEYANANGTALSIGDTSQWQIETDDLTEIDVVHVKEGARVNISVDALPGEEFEGIVTRVAPKSETKAGDVTYTVFIDITTGDTPKLRWGMTTFVDIVVDQPQ